MSRQTTSIKVDPQKWRKFKAKTSLKGEKISDTLETLIEGYLEGDGHGKG